MISDIQKTAENKMQRSLEVLRENLAKVRTGRAHTGLLDQVTVEYWGSEVPVSQVGNVTLLDARTIGVKPFESNMAVFGFTAHDFNQVFAALFGEHGHGDAD